jgi:hypothetical protein
MRDISRTAPVGTRVMAYRNLHKGCWSVKSLKTGRVLAHLDEVFISDALFRVSEAGRQRVLRERVKNVHAGVVGVVSLPPGAGEFAPGRRVRYNPYQAATFLTAPDGAPILGAPLVHLDAAGGAYALEILTEAGETTCKENLTVPLVASCA